MKRLLNVSFCVLILLALAVQAQAQNNKARIYGKVAVILKSQEVRPIPKRRFLVLPYSLWELNLKIMAEADKKFGPEPEITGSKEQFQKRQEHTVKTFAYRTARMEEETKKTLRAGKGYEFTTDFNGKYEVNVSAGNWFICNADTKDTGLVVYVGQSQIRWEVPVKVRAGQQLNLDISNDNAAEIN